MSFDEQIANQTVHIINSWPDVPIETARKIARENILERIAWRVLACGDSPTAALEAHSWLSERQLLNAEPERPIGHSARFLRPFEARAADFARDLQALTERYGVTIVRGDVIDVIGGAK